MATRALDATTLQDTVKNSPIVILDFWASWCRPCLAFGPVFEQASEAHPDVVFGKIDTQANQELSMELGIQSIPTLMVFRDGVLLYREAGALPAPAFEDLIQQVKGLDMEEVHRDIAAREAGGGEG